ncbi:uncharacterized protein TNCV_1938351 [Trichonephila clavipes]|nr:uncharacterized protein TNCV_1938351 [Trichonephila clavipes]
MKLLICYESFQRMNRIVASCLTLIFCSDEDIRMSESNCEESKESTDLIDNIPVNPNIYVARDDTEGIPHNSNVPGRFATPNVLQQSSGGTHFTKYNVSISFFI